MQEIASLTRYLLRTQGAVFAALSPLSRLLSANPLKFLIGGTLRDPRLTTLEDAGLLRAIDGGAGWYGRSG